MNDVAKRYVAELSALPAEIRADVAHALLATLDDQSSPEEVERYRDEIARRLDDLLSGRVQGIDGDAYFRKALAKYE